MTDKDGGPAFPNYKFDSDVGMSLRDYFAAAALPKLLTMSWASDDATESIAKASYAYADAMLAERGDLDA